MSNCAVATCSNLYKKTKDKGVTYHRFPECPNLRETWLLYCKRQDFVNVKNARICSEHFTPDDFIDDMKNRLLGLRERKILKSDAVPSVNLPFQNHEEDISSRSKRKRKKLVLQEDKNILECLSPKKNSGTVVKEVKDHSPIEPAVKIKEEPPDEYPNPSTSNDTANPEFILPDENSWTPPASLVEPEFILPDENNSWRTPATVVEPQFTLSVASLAVPNVPETSDGGQLKMKRENNPSEITTLVSVPKDTEVRPQNPVYKVGEISNLDSPKEHHKDQFDAFGEYIANKLRSLDLVSSAVAQKAIGNIILEAEMGKYLPDAEHKVLHLDS